MADRSPEASLILPIAFSFFHRSHWSTSFGSISTVSSDLPCLSPLKMMAQRTCVDGSPLSAQVVVDKIHLSLAWLAFLYRFCLFGWERVCSAALPYLPAVAQADVPVLPVKQQARETGCPWRHVLGHYHRCECKKPMFFCWFLHIFKKGWILQLNFLFFDNKLLNLN